MSNIKISENVLHDPQRGFSSFGDFARAIASKAVNARRPTGVAPDPRLILLASAPGTYIYHVGATTEGCIVGENLTLEVTVK